MPVVQGQKKRREVLRVCDKVLWLLCESQCCKSSASALTYGQYKSPKASFGWSLEVYMGFST